jgi:hypothetical protein
VVVTCREGDVIHRNPNLLFNPFWNSSGISELHRVSRFDGGSLEAVFRRQSPKKGQTMDILERTFP